MNKNNKAFTIIELLIAITVITIVTLGWSNIQFRSISNKQSLEISTNKIISEIERIRNNSLIWKGIWINIDVPKMWRIDFSTSWSWAIKTNYTNDWTNWIIDNSMTIDKFSINKVKCINVNWIETNLNNTQTWSIFFEWWKYKLWSDCNTLNSSIMIETFYKWHTKNIEFDIISWIIKR